MISLKKHRVIRFGSHNTRRNLPSATSSKRGESNFLACFEKIFLKHECSITNEGQKLASGREFALEGFGRADLLSVVWKHTETCGDFTALTLRNQLRMTAVEAKMTDWRKGLMQAARYRFFANRALLVLPPIATKRALVFLVTFRDLNVGLWEFDEKTHRLTKHFTPRSRRPLNFKAREKALDAIIRGLKFR